MQSQVTIGAQRNDRIVLVRLLCIFGMIYVHVPAIDSVPIATNLNSLSFFDFLRGFLIEGYGRTSACLLSVVSGYLVANSLANKQAKLSTFYSRKFSSIYVPMFVWGLATVIVFAFASVYESTVISRVCGAQRAVFAECVNIVFHLGSIGAGPTIHLAFLRDLFVCMLLAPLLITLLRSRPALVLIILLALYLTNYSSIIILRPLIVLGFSVGLALSLYKTKTQWVDGLCMLWVWLAFIMTLHVIAFNAGQLPRLESMFLKYGYDAGESLLYPLTRLFGALAIWSLSLRLCKTRLVGWSKKLEPVLFVAFCAHVLMFAVLHGAGKFVVPNVAAQNFYPIWFVIAPAMAIGLSWLGVRLCSVWLPSLLQVVAGGRVKVKARQGGSTAATQAVSAS